jgi:copper(I)-binding protein
MSRRARGYRPAFVVATMLTAALALAGCSAGTVTQTDTIVQNTAVGAWGQVGEIAIRDLTIDGGPTKVVPAGAPALLKGGIVNESPEPDRLVSVSSPYAVSVVPEGATAIPGDNAIRIVGAEPGPVGPPNQDERVSGTLRLTLQGTTQVLRPGPTYAVTLTFERAGTVTLPVIVTGGEVSAG